MSVERDILNTINEPVALIDKKCSYVFVNKAYAHYFRKEVSEITGRYVDEFIAKEDYKKTIKPYINRCLKGESLEYEHVLPAENVGPEKKFRITYTPHYNEKGTIEGVISIAKDITSELELQKDWEKVVHAIDDMLLVISPDFEILEANQNTLDLFKKSRDEVIGEKCYKLFHETDGPVDCCPLVKAKKSGTTETAECFEKLFGKSFSMRSSPVFNEEGEIVKYVDLVRDITPIKKYEESLKDQNEELAALNEEYVAANEELKQGEEELQATNEELQVSNEELLSNQEQLRASEKKMQSVLDNSPFPVAVVDTNDEHIFYWSHSAKEMFGHVPDTTKEWYELAYPNLEYRSEVLERWKPFVKVAEKSGRAVNAGEYNITCKDGSVKICELYAQFIPGNLIVTLNDITERKAAEIKLQKREELLRLTGKMAKVGGWEVDLESNTVSWSEETHRIHEVPMDQKPSIEEAINFFHPEDRPLLQQSIKKAIKKGEPYDLFLRFITAKGKHLIAHTICQPEVKNGKVVKLKGTFHDVTELKKTEEELKKKEALLRSSVESPLDMVILSLDRDYRYLYFNETHRKVMKAAYGRSPEPGKCIFDYMTNEDDIKRIKKRYDIGLQGKSNVSTDIFGDKVKRYYRVHINPILDENKEIIGITSYAHDITEIKKAEDDLKASQLQLKNIVENSTNLFYSHTADHVITYLSPQVRDYLGYEPDEAMKRWTEFVTDNPINEEGFKLTEKAIKTGQQQPVYELELQRKNDSKIIVEVRETPVVENGKVVSIVGSLVDITERKQAEAKIKENEAMLMAALDNSQAGIAIAEVPSGKLKYVNKAGLLIRNRDYDEIVKDVDIDKYVSSWQILHFDGTPYKPQDVPLARAVLKGERVKEEFVIRRDDNEDRIVLAHAAPINDDKGERSAAIVVFLDITDTKKTEEELENIKWLLQTSVDDKRKSETYTPFYGDVTQLNTERTIMDAVGKDDLVNLAGETIDLLGTSVAVYEKNGDYAFGMFSSGWCQLMDATSRKLCGDVDNIEALSCGKWLCHENCWNESAKRAIETGKPIDIECIGGIYLYAEPIIAGNEVVGVINIGYGDPPKDEKTLKELADKFHMDIQKLKDASRNYQSRPSYIISLAKKQLKTTAKLLGDMVERSRIEKERKSAQEKLKASLARYSTLFSSIPIGLTVTDSKGNIIESNTISEKLLGLSNEEQAQRKIDGEEWKIIKPDGKAFPADEYASVKALKENRLVENVEMGIVKSDDKITWINVSAIPIPLEEYGVLITYTDITARKNAEMELHKNQRDLKELVMNSPVCIKKLDPDFNLQFMSNPGIEQLKIDDINDFYGKPYPLYFFPEPFKLHMSEKLKEVKETGKAIELDGILSDTKGNKLWYKHLLAPVINEFGKLDYILVVSMNITREKNAEKELIIAKNRAEESDLLKSAFLANMSHEIRTPMNGILGFTDLLADEEFSLEERSKYIDIIKKNGERLIATINDLIDISRIESGQANLNLTETNIDEQISDVYSFFKKEADKKGIDLLLFKPDSKSNINVKTDAEKLYSILTNLVKNALKFTRQGRISLGYTIKDDKIEFYVKDTGMGIAKDRQQAIFNRFVQADIDHTRPYEGSGLGLAITKAYVEMLGGEIKLRSEEGKGSTFSFIIPYEKISMQKTSEGRDNKHAIHKQSVIEEIKILIVEDEESSREYLNDALRKYCRHIDFASNGKEAVDKLQQNNDFDIVLMDLKMPVMDGYEATKKIRVFNKDVIIIAQTAYAMQGDREKALEAGCNDYISKPIKRKLLLEKLREYTRS